MFQQELIPYKKLHPVKNAVLRERFFVNLSVCAWIIGMLFMCVLIMSLMIVKVSSTELLYRNQTPALRDDNLPSDNSTRTDTTTPESVNTVYQEQRRAVATTHPTLSNSQPLEATNLKQNALAEEMRTKRRQQEPDAPPQQDLHAIAGETAYLLERGDDTAHERERERERARGPEHSIYGTWRTKARRPQQQLVAATATSAPAEVVATAASTKGTDRIDVGKPYQHHVYERLPKRSSTMTSIKSEFRDQIPRPPRLTSRQPSLVMRRQFMETPMNVSYTQDQHPKPFHFPHDGPMPEEFKKVEAERAEVNNIQDILQHMQLGGGSMKTPQMVMMPTGLHIAGSFKNLKSSGIANFFRNRRNKKQVQISFPIPMPMPIFGGYQAPVVGGYAQPYQRIALEQFYPFKPRSPNEVNLLAMQQQLQANRSKHKSKKKQKKAMANTNLLLQHSNQHPFAADSSHVFAYPHMFALNATQKPKLKHIPFKVNLDIYPVMPPTKDYKATAFNVEETKMSSSMRPPNFMHNPFGNIYSYPIAPSAHALPYHNPYEQQLYPPLHYPSAVHPAAHVPQSGDARFIFPDQLSKQMPQQQQQKSKQQQQQQQQQQHQFRMHSSQSQTPFQAVDYVYPSATSNSANALSNPKSNQIMVHLNVFPKQKPSVAPVPSTNPFYGSTFSVNRNTIQEESDVPSLNIEPHSQPQNSNLSNSHVQLKSQLGEQLQQQQQQSISRSDTFEQPPFVDFNHPIVAAELSSPELPQSAALISNKLDSSDSSPHYDHIEARTNFNYNPHANVEQLASEAQAASLFRFPVEDLIQFQVGDAL